MKVKDVTLKASYLEQNHYSRILQAGSPDRYQQVNMTDILDRKEQLKRRLAKYGIKEHEVDYLRYLEFDANKFATPYETGCRMMVLYSVSYTASELDDRVAIVNWLKRENLWEYVAPSELELFEGRVLEEQKLIDFSWMGECAYILAWTLNLIKDTPTPTRPISDNELDEFMTSVPEIGEKLGLFLYSLKYRDSSEVYDENIFHVLATTYFRDHLSDKNTSNLDRGVSYLRHKTLNWLTRFLDITEWDDTETST